MTDLASSGDEGRRLRDMEVSAANLKSEISKELCSKYIKKALPQHLATKPIKKLKPLRQDPVVQRILKGHFGKVYAVKWDLSLKNSTVSKTKSSSDDYPMVHTTESCRLISASQDAKLIVWNGYKTNKENAVPFPDSWVMSCDIIYSRTTHESTVLGCGMDTKLHLYKLGESEHKHHEFLGHSSFVSSCRYLTNSTEILTSSGDGTCILWDAEVNSVSIP
jgi:guanine nucleotide-binding protein G(I)/G(S)/G(T) subunit beta-1